jgi:hypothetical protein
MPEKARQWAAAYDLPVYATDEQIREAFMHLFGSLAFHITSRGGPGGEWDGLYVNAIPTKIEVYVDKDNLDRKIVLRCTAEEPFLRVFVEGKGKDGLA